MSFVSKLIEKKSNICVVGLGYVGLPLAVAFAEKYNVIGFDINFRRIGQLINKIDITNEVSSDTLERVSSNLYFTNDENYIGKASLIIVTVPTPVDDARIPDLSLVKKATETIGRNMSKNSIIVYESTVYPGVTKDICIPILEKTSALKWKKYFNVGYSPERINPGDKEHNVKNIKKVIAADTNEVLNMLAEIYGSIIDAGVYKASSIEVAEAAKVIENTQRDLNIALINELAVIFHKLGIDTIDVLEAAGTKWNFLKFYPGLVGGHCIGVDPYYLTYRSQQIGYHPEVILAGRKINDNMGKFIASETVKLLIKAGKTIKSSKVFIMGITFKENVSDIRNSKVIDIINELKTFGVDVIVNDVYANKEEVKKEYKISLTDFDKVEKVDGVVIAVAHDKYKRLGKDYFEKVLNGEKKVIVDIKSIFNRYEFINDNRYIYWRL